jgi:hypothetical protein
MGLIILYILTNILNKINNKIQKKSTEDNNLNGGGILSSWVMLMLNCDKTTAGTDGTWKYGTGCERAKQIMFLPKINK